MRRGCARYGHVWQIAAADGFVITWRCLRCADRTLGYQSPVLAESRPPADFDDFHVSGRGWSVCR